MNTALVGLGGVVLGVVLTSLLNFFLQKAADDRRWKREDEAQRERWRHEDEVQRERWRHEDRIRYQVERLSVYRDFSLGARRTMNSGGEEFDADRMDPLFHEIELIGSDEVVSAADDVRMHGHQYKHATARFRENREAGITSEEAALAIEESYGWFVAAAKDELGIRECRENGLGGGG